MCYHVQVHNSYVQSGSVRLGTDDPCEVRSSAFSPRRRYFFGRWSFSCCIDQTAHQQVFCTIYIKHMHSRLKIWIVMPMTKPIHCIYGVYAYGANVKLDSSSGNLL